MPKQPDRRCVTVVHEYAEHISSVLSKDRITLKSSCALFFLFLSLSLQLPSLKIPFIHLSCIPLIPLPSFTLRPEWQINAQVPTEAAHSFFIFPIIYNSLNLGVAMATRGPEMKEMKKGLFFSR